MPEALDRLAEAGFLSEATRLVVHGLPRREAVWWACMCAYHTMPATLPTRDRRAVQAARSWACRPRVETARVAMGRRAAFWSGDGEAVTPYPGYLAGAAIAGAVGIAAIRSGPRHRAQRLKQFFASAQDIALGGKGRILLEA